MRLAASCTQAQECVVEGLLGERMAGLIAWGQWRGWYQPPCGTMGQPPCAPEGTGSEGEVEGKGNKSLGGEMGNGIMMNTQLSYLNNQILEGNKIVRWSDMGGGSYSPGFGKFYNGATFSIEAVSVTSPTDPAQCKNQPGGKCHDWSLLAASVGVIYRGNIAHSNGGFNIGGGLNTASIRDVIIEGNTILQSDPDKAMQISPLLLPLGNGTCIVRDNVLPA